MDVGSLLREKRSETINRSALYASSSRICDMRQAGGNRFTLQRLNTERSRCRAAHA